MVKVRYEAKEKEELKKKTQKVFYLTEKYLDTQQVEGASARDYLHKGEVSIMQNPNPTYIKIDVEQKFISSAPNLEEIAHDLATCFEEKFDWGEWNLRVLEH